MPIELPGDDPRNFKISPKASVENTFGTLNLGKPKETNIILNHDTGDYSIVKMFHGRNKAGKSHKFKVIEGTITGYLKRG
jgi:hypothetical protein